MELLAFNKLLIFNVFIRVMRGKLSATLQAEKKVGYEKPYSYSYNCVRLCIGGFQFNSIRPAMRETLRHGGLVEF